MPMRTLRRIVIKPVMPVGMYRNHRPPRGIARHALLLSYGWNRGQSGADSQRCEAYREFGTHDFFLLFVSRNAPRRPKRQAIPCAFGSPFSDAVAMRRRVPISLAPRLSTSNASHTLVCGNL